jgi:lysozyme
MTNEAMRTGADGIELCQHYEQLRLLAYPDPGSPLAKAIRANLPAAQREGLSGAPWTIGWGDTGPDVVEGLVIDEQEANVRFARRLAQEFEPAVRRAVKVELTQRQFDAMVSIVYNVGPGARDRDGIVRLASGQPSTLLRKLNAGDFAGAAAQFPAWNRSGGEVMKGLQRRREAERLVFLGMDANSAIVSGEAKYP